MQVHIVLVALQSPGVVSNAIFRGDMVFREDTPVLVLEWTGDRGSSEPRICVKLDAAHLKPAEASDQADYVHTGPVDDPRGRQPGHG